MKSANHMSALGWYKECESSSRASDLRLVHGKISVLCSSAEGNSNNNSSQPWWAEKHETSPARNRNLGIFVNLGNLGLVVVVWWCGEKVFLIPFKRRLNLTDYGSAVADHMHPFYGHTGVPNKVASDLMNNFSNIRSIHSQPAHSKAGHKDASLFRFYWF